MFPRKTAALVAVLHLQLFHCHFVDSIGCAKENLITRLFVLLHDSAQTIGHGWPSHLFKMSEWYSLKVELQGEDV